MRVEIHSLAWMTTSPKIIKAHSDVCKHFGLTVNYTVQNIRHGEWMDAVMDKTDADIVLFLDIDCVPTNKDIVDKAIAWVMQHGTFIGIAQASNHIPPYSHIFAAPAFFAITKKIWDKMSRPTFLETEQSDVAENVSYAAEEKGKPYRALYPVKCREPLWRLGNYGMYGIGTEFIGGIYHLYQSRMAQNISRMRLRCSLFLA